VDQQPRGGAHLPLSGAFLPGVPHHALAGVFDVSHVAVFSDWELQGGV